MSITTIEWTKRPGTVGETWNPTTGCNKVDRGCKNCYAEILHKRLQAMGQPKYAAPFLAGLVEHAATLTIPLGWGKPRTVFVNSMSDLFHEATNFDFIGRVLNVMRKTPQHTYLVLTKRPEIVLHYQEVRRCSQPGYQLPRNLWLGTSANDQASANRRVPLLLQAGASVHFLSYEPATGPLDLTQIVTPDMVVGERWTFNSLETGDVYTMHGDGDAGGTMPGDGPQRPHRLDWVICGGESGPKASPMHPDWARRVRDDCERSEVPFFFKQWGMWTLATDMPDQMPGEKRRCKYAYHGGTSPTKYVHRPKKSGNLLDGKQHQAFPR